MHQSRSDQAISFYKLGSALCDQGKFEQAIPCFRRALEIDASYIEAHNDLGTVFLVLGKLDEAIACFSRATGIEPKYVDAQCNLGSALLSQGKLDEAVACFRRALEINPDFAAAHYNLGTVLQAQGKLEDAVAAYREAIALQSDYGDAWCNLGASLQAQDKANEAVSCFHRALEIRPDYPEAFFNLGFTLQHAGSLDEALANYDRAIALRPSYAEPRFGQATIRLLRGDFQRGWPEYEWRWRAHQVSESTFSQPRWDGSPLEQRSVLLQAEQGFGDTIQFIRYARLVKDRNPRATVVVECQPPLAKLLANSPGIDCLVAQGETLPRFDVHLPLLSLPLIFQTTVETIPSEVPYLFAADTLVEQWRVRLSGIGGFRIGINWQGRPGGGDFRKRNIGLQCFQRLAEIPGVTLISLQRGPGRDELLSSSNDMRIVDLGDDFDTAQGRFMDTAAVMKNLDLVITCDTSIPHLAGALGVPVWLALPYVPDWRWLLDRSDSPWYPTMRLFRQVRLADWEGVFENMAAALGDWDTNRR
jgi:tetratricopeptide (TPR) repeat protein